MIRISDPCGWLCAQEYADADIESALKEVRNRILEYGNKTRVKIQFIKEVSVDDFLNGASPS